MWVKVTVVMWVKLVAWGVEDEGTINHLLEGRDIRYHNYSLSYSSSEALPVKPHTWFKIKFSGECQKNFALDPTPKGMEGAFPFGVPRRHSICNVDKIGIYK